MAMAMAMTMTATAMLRTALAPRHLILSTSMIDTRTSGCFLRSAAAAAKSHHRHRRSTSMILFSFTTLNSFNRFINSKSSAQHESILQHQWSYQTRRNFHRDHGYHATASSSSSSSSNANLKDVIVPPYEKNNSSSNGNNNNNRMNVPEDGPPRTSVLMELTDRVGALHDVLRYFWKYDVNITRIESRIKQNRSIFDFFVDFHGQVGDSNIDALLRQLQGMTDKLLVLDEKEVHWFPRHISELDLIANRTLDAGVDLEADHPGFHDIHYRQRRAKLAELALNHRMHHEIPHTEYTKEEVETWGLVWDTMEDLWAKYACKEYMKSMKLMKEHCNYHRDAIPQLSSISSFLRQQTNFRLRPVAGLISSRDFLNGLAFRTFFCTQYIRHPSKPLYTPEPDICHELLGHVPMFVDRDFCDFSQEIGLASLGASEEDVLKLARCYWHSIEFGLCKEDGKHKAYGAGLLSSFGELEYACKERGPDDEIEERPEMKPWDPAVAAMQDFPITTYQPVYFLADSLADAKVKMRKYCENLPRPFFALYNAQAETVHIDRPVRRAVGAPSSE